MAIHRLGGTLVMHLDGDAHRRVLLLLDALYGERKDRSVLFWKSRSTGRSRSRCGTRRWRVAAGLGVGKRVTILWAVLTPIAIMVFERVAIGTHYVQDMLGYRLDDPVIARFMAGQRTRSGSSWRHQQNVARRCRVDARLARPRSAFLTNPGCGPALVVAAGSPPRDLDAPLPRADLTPFRRNNFTV